MKFINKGEDLRFRRGKRGNHSWAALKHGETMDLDKDEGLKLGFCPVTDEGKIGKVKVETKQFKKKGNGFQEELESINGVGKKTAEDIVKVFPTEEGLKIAISVQGKHIPFRDDIVTKLIKKYGGKNGR